MSDQPTEAGAPPIAKYRLTVTVTGNSWEELYDELGPLTKGTLLMDSAYETRDEFLVYGGRSTRKLEHANPEMTSERYEQELHDWAKARRYIRDTQ